METVLGRNFYHIDRMSSDEFNRFMFDCRNNNLLRELYNIVGCDIKKQKIRQFLK